MTGGSETEGRPARSRLLNRDFLLLWQGQLASQVGNQAFGVAMMFWAMEATGSASLMGLLMMVGMIPGVVLGPLGGTLADRHSRKVILVMSDLASGLVMLVLAVPFFLPQADNRVLIPCLLAMAILLGVAQAFFRPAMSASIPELVPRAKVPAANSLNQFSLQFSTILGQGLGGLLFRWLGAPFLFVIDGLSFLFSAASESFIHLPSTRRLSEEEAGASSSFWQDLLDGLGFLKQQKGMLSFLALAATVNFFIMPIMVLLPFFVSDYLLRDAAWYGFLIAGLSGGSIVGYLVASTLPLSGRWRAPVLLADLVLASGLLVILGFLTNPKLALLVMVLEGVLNGFLNILIMTTFQVTTPTELRGRIMGVVSTVAMGVAPLGAALGGVLGDLTGKNIPLIYVLCGSLIGASSLLLGSGRRVRKFLSFNLAEEREEDARPTES